MRPARSRLLCAATILAAVLSAGEAAADCTCRAQGRDFDLGRSVCLATPSGFRLATCDMVINNTSWKISSTPCVAAAVRPDAGDDPAPLRRMLHHGYRAGG